MYQDQVNDRLDSSTFPYVKDAPTLMPLSPRSPPPQTTSLRSQKPSWHRAPKTATVLDNRQRLLVFVAGGVTYSEIRETYQLSNSLQKDIYIGELGRILLIVDNTANSKELSIQVLRIRSHLADLLMISKFWILVVRDRKPYPMDYATCEENRNRLKTFMMRNILWRKQLYPSRSSHRHHLRRVVSLDSPNHHRPVLSLHQAWHRALKKRRRRRNGGWAGLVVEESFFLTARTLLVYNNFWSRGCL